MARRDFNNCLNKEHKAYNCSIGSLLFGGIFFSIFTLIKGFLWGIGGSAIGFMLGRFLSKHWHEGNIQRSVYWHLPFVKALVDSNMPESHHRKIM